MTTKISVYNLDNTVTSAIGSGGGGIIISSLQIATAAWVVKDDTAVDTAGGYAIITGSGFASGCNVIIGSQNASAVSFVSSTTLRVTIPAQAAGTYTVYVVNPNGAVGIIVNGLTYSGTPSWVTGSTLTSGQVNSSISIQLSATGESVTYALQAGSSLPSGLTLTSGGLLSGTVTGITVETVYNFTIEAIDAQAQESPRAFSITITATDPYFKNINLLLSADNSSNTFIKDSSNNNFNITINGDIKPSNFNPYVEGYYSNYFDGSGDSLSVSEPAGTAGAATVEFWIYPVSQVYSGDAFIVGNTGNGVGAWALSYATASRVISVWSDSYMSPRFSSTATAALNTWTHIALVKTGGVLYLYINGIQQASTYTSGNNFGRGTSIVVGQYSAGGQEFTGYISNLRVVYGTAVYTANSTPSTAPLTAIANTVLLTCQSNRFIDNSANNFTITRNGDVRIDGFDPFVPTSNTATYGSGYFDGTGDYLRVLNNAALQFGSGSFTLECWIYVTGGAGTRRQILGKTGAAAVASVYSYSMEVDASNKLTFFVSDGSAFTSVSSTNTIGLNIWYHVASVRDGNTLRIFINGVAEGTTAFASSINDTAFALGIGATGEFDGLYFLGNISNVRIVKGTAVYTSAFTPANTPLTAIANTSLLTLQTNQPTNNHMFVDNSTANHLITRAGNATQGSFSPYSGAWSNYFDGTGDYLTIPDNAAFDLGSGNFTFEVWVYPTSAFTTSTEQFLLNQWASANYGYEFSLITNGTSFTGIRFAYSQTGAVGNITTRNYTQTIPLNSWSHIAFVRNSGTTTAYYNGTSIGTSSDNVTIFNSTQTVHIGASPDGGINQLFYGYLSNMRLVKGTAVYTSTFTPPIQPLTTIANTSLLTCADNRFIDNSNNNFTITRTGDVSVQKFSPFSMQTQVTPRSYSVFFDGTGDYLQTPSNAAFDITGVTSYTVECWFYATSLPAALKGLVTSFNGGNGGSFWMGIDASNKMNVRTGNDASVVSGATTIVIGQWYHMALVRDGATSMKGYLNGVLEVSSASFNWTGQTQACFIGSYSGGTGPFTGYISNARVVKGTAVYTSAFTPPTAPLTAIANTSLLTCQSTTLIDNSNNAFAITVNGDSRPIIQNPFGYTSANIATYATTALGGSMYFDGTGDWLSIPNAGIPIGTGDFTVECWVYPTVLGSYDGFISSAIDNGGALGISLSRDQAWIGNNTTVALSYNWSSLVVVGRWCHLAVTRSGTTVRFFVNGALMSTGTASTNMNSTQYAIGRRYPNWDSAYPTGYIADARVIVGTAAYTSSFVPPAAPVTAVSNTRLLLSGTGGGIIDSSMNNNLETVGDASVNTSIVKFAGKSSIAFDGTGDYLRHPSNQTVSFGTGDFTIEAWIYWNSLGSTSAIMWANGVGWTLYIYPANKLQWGTTSPQTALNLLTGSTTLATGQWYHIAVTKASGTVRMFVNGTLDGSVSDGFNYSAAGFLEIGRSHAGNSFNGYISDLRITRGVARYTSNFTPPSSPFITF